MRAPKDRAPLLIAWTAFALIAGFIIAAQPDSPPFGDRVMREVHPDVPENLPPGDRPYSWPSKWALQIAATHHAPQFDSHVTVEPVFYFPAWQVRCDGQLTRTFPDPESKLLSYEGHNCSRTLVPTTPERIGAILSLAALLVLVSLAFSPWLLAQRRSLRLESRLRNT